MLHGDPPRAVAGAFPRPFGSKYVLLRHLATGGMADVFLARQSGPAGFVKECVIKPILPHLAHDTQFISMFLDEARLCARLNHPNIAQVFDLGKVGDDYFIAMEHVHGVDLEAVMERAVERGEDRLPIALAVRIVSAVADGLEHAHNAADAQGRPLGIVHRDVTPSNVVISFDGVPKLLDFGIAKATTRHVKSESGVIKGKAPYMSPEQIQSLPLDGRSDLFSLGSILFEVTTGVKPWAGENAAGVGIKILHDDPTPPSLLVRDYPDALEAIVLGALAKKVQDRVATARALQVQLEKFLVARGEHVSAHDVAKYLEVRFPKERVRLTLLEGGTGNGRGENHEDREVELMSERPIRPTGPMSIGDPPPMMSDLPGDGFQPRRNLGGGGGGRWIAVVIVVLVALTGVGLFFLRKYQTNKEANAAAAGRDLGPSSVVGEAPKGDVPKEEPKVAAKVEAGKEEPKAVEPKVVEPKVTELAPEPPAEKKTSKRHSSSHHSSKPPAAGLPHLPKPPPTTD